MRASPGEIDWSQAAVQGLQQAAAASVAGCGCSGAGAMGVEAAKPRGPAPQRPGFDSRLGRRRGAANAPPGAGRVTATYHGADEGLSDYLLTAGDDWVEDEPELDVSCQIVQDPHNFETDEGGPEINGRAVDECTDDLDCAPQVKFAESGNTEEDKVVDGAQVGGENSWLELLYPGVATAIARSLNRRDFHWCYFNVWMGGVGYTSNLGKSNEQWGLVNMPNFWPRWGLLVAGDYESERPYKWEPTSIVIAAAGVQHFAVYDYVIADNPGERYMKIRYWVGCTLHPSAWADQHDLTATNSLADVFPETLDLFDVRIQTFMVSMLRVRARLVWRASRFCKTKYTRNTRDYPLGGLTVDLLQELYRDENGNTSSVTEAYENDQMSVNDLHWSAAQPARSDPDVDLAEVTPSSCLGNMLRGTVKFGLRERETRTVAEMVRAGFECLFGSRVVTRMDFKYVPHGDPTNTDAYNVMVRKCLTASGLVHIDEYLSDTYGLKRSDEGAAEDWAKHVYQARDAASIDADRLS